MGLDLLDAQVGPIPVLVRVSLEQNKPISLLKLCHPGVELGTVEGHLHAVSCKRLHAFGHAPVEHKTGALVGLCKTPPQSVDQPAVHR